MFSECIIKVEHDISYFKGYLMDKFNSIKFVDSLAEVTSHDDKEVIERSLLQTLTDYTPNSEYRIYRILPNAGNKTVLALMAYVKNNIIDSLGYEIKTKEFHEDFLNAINKALESKSIQIINSAEEKGKIHVIYPATNKSNDNFAVLIQSCEEINFDHQRLVHSLLKVYSNYLELIDKARRDKLTKLLNRETLDAEITRILIRNNTSENDILQLPIDSDSTSHRHAKNNSYWLAILDIDFFKNINDSYGHLYGDEILILVARLLEESIRDNDFAYRYGGEEFVVIMLSENEETAKQGFERIRTTINEHSYANVEGLSVSIGVTHILNQKSPTEVLGEADTSLYYAKDNGRNQTHFYAELVKDNLIKVHLDETECSEVDFF